MDDGYTAAEGLAALLIIGLAVGGLTSAMHVIGRTDRATTVTAGKAVSIRQAEAEVARLLVGAGPIRSDDGRGLRGQETSFTLPCATGACGARLEGGALVLTGAGVPSSTALPGRSNLRFAYISDLGASPVWPPVQPPPPAPAWEVLHAIVVQQGPESAPAPLLVARIWEEQEAACDYDTILQDCRRGRP